MKVKKLIKFVFLFFALSSSGGCILGSIGIAMLNYRHYATARFHVIIKDAATGLPMKGVHVKAEFVSRHGGWNGTTHSSNVDDAYTDKNGRCTVSGIMNDPEGAIVGVDDLSGYYLGYIEPKFDDYSVPKLNRWQPDGQVLELPLEKIGNQIPLFIHKASLHKSTLIKDVPIDSWWPIEKTVSYDLMKADWMPPFGKGEVADITFKRYSRISLGIGKNPAATGESFADRMTVTFNGEENGILEFKHHPHTSLKIRTAPHVGYIKQRDFENLKDKNLNFKQSGESKVAMCFRIRTRKNENGDIIESYYGKMYNDFGVRLGSRYAVDGVEFTYYLNTSNNDRNLEWDQKTNLCPVPYPRELRYLER